MEENIKVVVDASIILSRIMPDEIVSTMFEDEYMDHIKKNIVFIAPKLLSFEILSALKSACKSKRLDIDLALDLYNNFDELDIRYLEIDLSKVISLALKYNLSTYDAVYLRLAIENKCRLLTLDKQLKAIFDKIVI